jgi:hypothetical protein
MDDCGALLATEWVVLATIIVIGIIPGLVAIRQGTLTELVDFSNAEMSLDQSFEFGGEEIHCTDGIRVVGGSGRQTMGNGSITEISGGTAEKTRTGGGLESPRGGSSQQGSGGSVAMTAGSAFSQGNHTEDGNDMHSSTKHLSNGRVEPAGSSSTSSLPCD